MRITNRIMLIVLVISLLIIFSGMTLFGWLFIHQSRQQELHLMEERVSATKAYLHAQQRLMYVMAGEYSTAFYIYFQGRLHQLTDASPDNQEQFYHAAADYIGHFNYDNIDIHYMALLDEENGIIYGRYIDENQIEYDDLPDKHFDQLSEQLQILNATEQKAIFLASDQEDYLVAIAPLKVNGQGNSENEGRIVIGRRIDARTRLYLQEFTRSPVKLLSTMPETWSNYNVYSGFYTRNFSMMDTHLTMYVSIQDSPMVLLELQMARTVFIQQLVNLSVIMTTFLIFTIVLIITVALFVNKRLLRPLEVFTDKISKIDMNQFEPIKMHLRDNNELAVMNKAFNRLLQTIRDEREQLSNSEHYLRTMISEAPIGIAVSNLNSDILDVNDAFCELVGRSREELISLNFRDITYPSDLRVKQKQFRDLLSAKIDRYKVEKRYIRPDQTPVWVQMTAARLDPAGGQQNRILYMAEDISERVENLSALHESERSKDVILFNLPGMAYRCLNDEFYTMLFISPGCYKLTGYAAESLIQNRDLYFNELIAEEYRRKTRLHWDHCLALHRPFQYEYPIKHANGEIKWVYEQGLGIYNEKGEVEALEGLIIDVTTQKLHEQRIEFLNEHDVLTGLYNRRYYEHCLQIMDKEDALPLTILIGDINGLKLVNDAFGHNEGDQLIRETARILQENCREQDVLARTGGDEFTILLPNTDSETGLKILKTIQIAVKNYNDTASNELFQISISLGCETRNRLSQTISSIIDRADDFMRKRKLLEQRSSQSSVVASILATLNERNQETEAHAERLGRLSMRIGVKLGLSQFDIDKLILVARLHDIGKINIDDNIINKPGPLTDEEWELMRKHPDIGYRIAIASPELVSIADLILTHHEHWDGSGYPQGLKGDEIPLLSRILSITDAFDAMVEDRPYRKAMSHEKALDEISRCAGTQFDPIIAEVFVCLMREENQDDGYKLD